MNILCLDTSGGACSAAIAQNGKILAEQYTNNGLTHSATLMGLIDGCFSRARLQPEDIGLIAVTIGPGSFTGLRIGMSTAKAFAHSCQCNIAQVGTLEAIAHNFAWAMDVTVCPMLDARHARVYAGIWRNGQAVLPQGVYELAELQQHLQAQPAGQILFAGDGADVYGQTLLETFPAASIAPAALRYPHAAALAQPAQLQAAEGKTVSAYDAALEYLVASQAERNLKK